MEKELWNTKLENYLMSQMPRLKAVYRIYICSPCNADTAEGINRNMWAVRYYMNEIATQMDLCSVAPHAYLPLLMSDYVPEQRVAAMQFGMALLQTCGMVFVCGSRLSPGMRCEIASAVQHRIPIRVFNQALYESVRDMLAERQPPDTQVELELGYPTLRLGAEELQRAGYLSDCSLGPTAQGGSEHAL